MEMTDSQFIGKLKIIFVGGILIFSFVIGFMSGSANKMAEDWKQSRMFDRCLEYKKNFDECRREFP